MSGIQVPGTLLFSAPLYEPSVLYPATGTIFRPSGATPFDATYASTSKRIAVSANSSVKLFDAAMAAVWSKSLTYMGVPYTAPMSGYGKFTSIAALSDGTFVLALLQKVSTVNYELLLLKFDRDGHRLSSRGYDMSNALIGSMRPHVSAGATGFTVGFDHHLAYFANDLTPGWARAFVPGSSETAWLIYTAGIGDDTLAVIAGTTPYSASYSTPYHSLVKLAADGTIAGSLSIRSPSGQLMTYRDGISSVLPNGAGGYFVAGSFGKAATLMEVAADMSVLRSLSYGTIGTDYDTYAMADCGSYLRLYTTTLILDINKSDFSVLHSYAVNVGYIPSGGTALPTASRLLFTPGGDYVAMPHQGLDRFAAEHLGFYARDASFSTVVDVQPAGSLSYQRSATLLTAPAVATIGYGVVNTSVVDRPDWNLA